MGTSFRVDGDCKGERIDWAVQQSPFMQRPVFSALPSWLPLYWKPHLTVGIPHAFSPLIALLSRAYKIIVSPLG